jgi:hypothetical protein
MSDDKDRKRPHSARGRPHDKPDDPPPHSGGYFQGEPGEGNNPGALPLDTDPPSPPDEATGRGPDADVVPTRDVDPTVDPGHNRDEHLHGNSGQGYGGLSNRGFEDRGPGRVFDRGEDYGRADTQARGRVGQGASDAGAHDRRDRGADGAVPAIDAEEIERRRLLDEQKGQRPSQPRRD